MVVTRNKRTTLADQEGLVIAPAEWVTLRISHQGTRIQGWFNDVQAWEVNDAQLPEAGGVGLWTKADAASSFNGFAVRGIASRHAERLRDE